MLDLIIHKTADSEEAPVFLTLPASRWDELEAKAQLGMDSLGEGFFEYEPPNDIPQLGSILKTMWRGENYFEKLNYFAHRLTEMSASDRTLFNGALAIHGPDDMKSLINLTGHLNSIVMTEASTDAELGRFLVDNNFAEFPEEVIPYLDFAKVGTEHRANTSCAFDRNLYYEDLSPEIAEVYDGHALPEIEQPTHIFTALVFNHESDPTGENKITMGFPATQQELNTATARLGAHTMDELSAMVRHCPIARFLEMLEGPVEMIDLDRLAAGIDGLSDDQYIKLLAVMEHSEVDDLNEILNCMCQLDNYDFSPGIRPQDIGSYGLVRWAPVQEQTMVQAEPEMEMGCF